MEKNGLSLPNFNNGFHQQKQSCKILSCLDEIVFFYSELFARGNHFRNVETNFKRKTSLLLVETAFLGGEKQFFPFVKYSWL